MTKKLVLVDLENKHKADLSPLDESFKAIVLVVPIQWFKPQPSGLRFSMIWRKR